MSSYRRGMVCSGLGLVLGLSLFGCSESEGTDAPDLKCPKGMVPAWTDANKTVGECLPDLPLRTREPRTSLELPFPQMVRPKGSLNSPERIELGRLLFFDPLLSGDNTISCAHCHHPDKGFGDALPKARGIANTPVPRHTPTVWNAAFNKEQFWDGRAPTLEEQAKGPIQSDKEMRQDPAELVKELSAIPEYVQRFNQAFGGISFDNVAAAIATFERTVLSFNSSFDRYAAGDQGALSEPARRGFNLFRSVGVRCFECHGPPTFANPDYKVLGVPDLDNPAVMDKDRGRAEITPGSLYEFAFKVPTLRNVRKHGPYMHNGSLKTLEEVLDYYAKGGGPGRGYSVPNVDDKIRKYDLSAEERADLVAFLDALTDESLMPEVPTAVPSGYKVIERMK